MWEKVRDFTKDADAGMLEGGRATTGLMGFAFAAFTAWHIYEGREWTLGVVVMAALSVLGITGFLIYSKLVHERTKVYRKP